MDADGMLKVGVLTPHTAPGPEVELPAMAPGRLRVEISRIWNTVHEAASALPPSMDVFAIASTSAGYALGYADEFALVRRLHERWGVPVCSPSRAAVAALRSRHVKRIGLVHPPWFGPGLNDLGAEYFRSQGFEVVDARLAELPQDPSRIEPAMVVEWVAQHLSQRADAVFIGGNGFQAARAIHDLERRTGRLVLEANQVLLWSLFQNTGAPVAVRGFGRLFDG